MYVKFRHFALAVGQGKVAVLYVWSTRLLFLHAIAISLPATSLTKNVQSAMPLLLVIPAVGSSQVSLIAKAHAQSLVRTVCYCQ